MTTTAPAAGAATGAATTVVTVPAAAPPFRPCSALVIRPEHANRAAVLVAEGHVVRGPRRAPGARCAGERLHELFEQQADRLRAAGHGDRLAVDAGDVALTFDELDARANRLARHLLRRGVRAGARVALLVDRPVLSYVGMLAVSKVHAAFVPLDVGFPGDRIAYIVADAGVTTVLSSSTARDRVDGLDGLSADLVLVDDDAGAIGGLPGGRLGPDERGDPVEALAWIIYTSGSTGRPKGVAVDHHSVCNFVRVAAEVYGLRPDDRVYQGMTIAFDFSVEEIWVPWAAGATLVPKPPGAALLGADLSAFLTARRVTALCCVPTLLATLEDDLPALRFLLVSGEACPQDLIGRWHRPDRRFLNVYGPTETTVTATWTVLHPDRPVTIGVPLPTYSVVVLDPEDPRRALPRGEIGEIGIAGVGLARGYVNREDRTQQAFVPDFLDLHRITANPSGRIYRTGDLGRIDDRGEVEYHGRIDLQVKVRGYRIELTEIESVLLAVPGVAAAVVDTHEPEPGTVELVGYYTVRRGEAVDPSDVLARLREQLPPYMVPAYLEQLAAIPMTTSDKADRKNLPPPTGGRLVVGEHVPAATATERVLAETLAAVVDTEQVSVTADVFDEIGATSLLVARFTARLRETPHPPPVSTRDVYEHRSLRALALALDAAAPAGEPAPAPDRVPARRAPGLRYALTALAQLVLLLAGVHVVALVLEAAYRWVPDAADLRGVVARGAVFTAITLLALCVAPVVVKWVLVGRWTCREIPLWGLDHLRFWVVRTLTRLSPLTLFVGSPLYVLHLRALGARIGRDVLILSRTVPVATDLVTIGPGTVIHRDASFTGYRAVPGRLQTGRVTLGADVLVGEKTVLDVDTRMEDGARLHHSSALHPGVVVPAGQTWHGSPAEPTTARPRPVPTLPARRLRAAVFCLLQLAALFVVACGGLTLLVVALAHASLWLSLLEPTWPATLGWRIPLAMLAVMVAAGLAVVLLRLAAMAVVPRLLAPLVRPGRVRPLYGLADVARRTTERITNARLFVVLLGDSSFVTAYLRTLGYDLSRVEQTGSNFGTQLRQDTPLATRIGTGTVVSDGLSVMNTEFSATAFRVGRVTVGERTFLGNDVAFPVDARVGDNCLLATKVLVPVDGPVRHDVGLLGSPPVEIPRSSARPPGDRFDVADRPRELRRRLRGKNRHNALTVAVVLLAWAVQDAVALLLVVLAMPFHPRFLEWAFTGGLVSVALFLLASSVLLERACLGFRSLRPRQLSLYERAFWRHERLWKLFTTPPLPGTPWQNLLWRLAGLRVGRRLFDDGCVIPEKSLVTLGDDVVLNADTVLQGHSLEDGVFTSDRIAVGSRSCLGVGAFVHHGTAIGEGSVLEADSFLMKGEQVPAGSTWRGNPAAPWRTARTGTVPP
ncbi:Pls/PosA family non-ribosomal peptide synthetase [Actinomycetospora rhizophila]|uniref:Pls/PosA family non-ribosomal peptide synthetase n=1 Tax=Actinomycetospora rhizophila TaxID=1416876 RepID=A0ABV9ZM70_9PSEU